MMIGIDLRFLGSTLVGYGRHAPEDLRNAGMDAQQRNADAYRAAMAAAQPALVRPDDLRNAWPYALPTHHPTHQTDLILRALRRPDWTYFGWLTAMAGVALIRAGWMLLR
jgi:hypothetical protein